MPFIWIDPPTGFMYGFPKVVRVDCLDEYTDWDSVLIENGYPANEKDTIPIRMWEATEEDVVNATVTTLHKKY
jgi:hypothetical protein